MSESMTDMKKQRLDIDRGWAWLVLVTVYFGILIHATTVFMGGVLYVAILARFDADEAKAALVGALNGGLMCLLGYPLDDPICNCEEVTINREEIVNVSAFEEHESSDYDVISNKKDPLIDTEVKGSLPEHISIARDTLDSKPFDEDLVTEKDKCLNSSEVTIRPLGKDGYDITKASATVEKGGVDTMTLHVGMLGIAGIVMLLFPFYSGPVGDYIFAAMIGLYTGGPNSLMTPITLNMVEVERLSTAHGLEYFFCGLGYLSGPYVAGSLYSATETYVSSFYTGGCVILLGSLMALMSTVCSTKNNGPIEVTDSEIVP